MSEHPEALHNKIPGGLVDAIFEHLGLQRRDVGWVVFEPPNRVAIQHFLRNEDGKFYCVNRKTGRPIEPGQYKTYHRDEAGNVIADYDDDAAQETIHAIIAWDKPGA